MAAQSKLTDREWALVEDVSKEFGYWRRNYSKNDAGESLGYVIKTRDLEGLLGIIARLSKEKEEHHNG